MTELPTSARECDRYGISNTAGAALATATLTDFGIVTEQDRNLIIDRSKLWRERERLRRELRASANNASYSLSSLYYDERKDLTICSSSVNSKCCITEEHVVLLEEPNSVYLGHVTPSSGSSSDIFSSILNYFEENNISLSGLNAIGCDGTAVNTGIHSGVIRRFEELLKQPVQWIICMMHMNELSLRHIFTFLDGTTKAPNAFSGSIGKSLLTCHTLKVVECREVKGNLPKCGDTSDLSKDQKYLYDMCHSVRNGTVSHNLASRDPGTMVHSRWLTTGNRILRLYVSTPEPSKHLQILAEYVMNVYAPTWFSIKLRSQCYYGAQHLGNLMKWSRYLPTNVRAVVDKCIQRNGYFGHPENILLAMLKDERAFVRELALRKVKRAREEFQEQNYVRKYVLPKFIFDAEDYFQIIDWGNIPRCEPPLTRHMTDAAIEQGIKDASVCDLEKYPCHTQAVERHVKIVTEASAAVCGEQRRDGWIRAKLESRALIPQYSSKKNWNI